MANFYREPDRRQGYLLPVDMADWVAETDVVHILLDAVALMDLSRFERRYVKRGAGAPPFAPWMMVSCCCTPTRTATARAARSRGCVNGTRGFRMIVGDEVPDHSVIARFRKRHRKDLEALFVEILKLCHAAGLVRVGVVALDGTKVKANAALEANRTAKSLAAEVAAMLAEAEAVDTEEDALFGDRRGDDLPAGLADRSQRLARLKACQEQLQQKADARARRQQDKMAAREAEEKASGKVNRTFPRNRPPEWQGR